MAGMRELRFREQREEQRPCQVYGAIAFAACGAKNAGPEDARERNATLPVHPEVHELVSTPLLALARRRAGRDAQHRVHRSQPTGA